MYHIADPFFLPLQASGDARAKAVFWSMERNGETLQYAQQQQKDNRETCDGSWEGLGIRQDSWWAGEEINKGLGSVMSYNETFLPLIIWTEAL